MNIKRLTTVALTLGLLVSLPLFAHHGSASYDLAKTVTMKGTITSWVLVNPHSQLNFDVKDSKGNVQHWSVEQPAPAMLFRNTIWTKTSLQPGDEITISGVPAKNGSFHMLPRKIVRMSDGKVLQDSTAGRFRSGICLDGVTYDADGLPHPCAN
jgi:hypothetical protein